VILVLSAYWWQRVRRGGPPRKRRRGPAHGEYARRGSQRIGCEGAARLQAVPLGCRDLRLIAFADRSIASGRTGVIPEMDDPAACVLCRDGHSVLLYAGVRHDPHAAVRRCTGCGLVFLSPRPPAEQLGQYHAHRCRTDYAAHSPDERYRSDLEEAGVRLRRLAPYVHRDARVLEIGCGSGAFLDVIRPHVGEVVGVEPDVASRMFIVRELGLPVLPDVGEALGGNRVLGPVLLFHVLEHVPGPVEFLQTLGRLVDTGGTLVLEVPNVDDALVSVYQVPVVLRFYYQRTHLYYSPPSTRARVLHLGGFRSHVEGIQRYDLSNHLRWMLTGEPGGQGYYRDLLGPSAVAAYADALIRAGASDTLWAVAQATDAGAAGRGRAIAPAVQ
jgi:SAM-dependent methyltransferase